MIRGILMVFLFAFLSSFFKFAYFLATTFSYLFILRGQGQMEIRVKFKVI